MKPDLQFRFGSAVVNGGSPTPDPEPELDPEPIDERTPDMQPTPASTPRVLQATDDEDYSLDTGVPPDGYKLALRQLAAERDGRADAIGTIVRACNKQGVTPDGYALALAQRKAGQEAQ